MLMNLIFGEALDDFSRLPIVLAVIIIIIIIIIIITIIIIILIIIIIIIIIIILIIITFILKILKQINNFMMNDGNKLTMGPINLSIKVSVMLKCCLEGGSMKYGKTRFRQPCLMWIMGSIGMKIIFANYFLVYVTEKGVMSKTLNVPISALHFEVENIQSNTLCIGFYQNPLHVPMQE